jgi:Cu2+-exporting ATPase
MSPISAAHLSQATADLVFLGKPLAPVVAAIDFSRKARHLMRQNLHLAIGYNVLAVPIAIFGFVTPLIAAAAMSGSSILVMLNALRARTADDGGRLRRTARYLPRASALSSGDA